MFYSDIVCAMTSASDVCIKPMDGEYKTGNFRLGWNYHASELHRTAREFFLMWVEHGKPKHGVILDLMKTSRARFKYTRWYLNVMIMSC